jgi:GT2 family glycosyltransferase
MKKPKLTVIILNHNTKELLKNCLQSLHKSKSFLDMQIIVSDNGSNDGSVEMLKQSFKWVEIVEGPNLSFANGNNRTRKITKGEYVLFLNTDTIIHENTLPECIRFMETDTKTGALTCKLILPNGKLDKDARRRFPTPWISFNRLFLKRTRQYWYEDIDPDITHEVDAIQGAFFLTKKSILDKVGWFDEKYYFDGEDLDLSFQIKKLGYKIVYFPEVSIVHIKKATRNLADKELKIRRKMEGISAMAYFYKKNLWDNYPLIFNYLVFMGIGILKMYRYITVKLK